jgi:hypothetical protein
MAFSDRMKDSAFVRGLQNPDWNTPSHGWSVPWTACVPVELQEVWESLDLVARAAVRVMAEETARAREYAWEEAAGDDA